MNCLQPCQRKTLYGGTPKDSSVGARYRKVVCVGPSFPEHSHTPRSSFCCALPCLGHVGSPPPTQLQIDPDATRRVKPPDAQMLQRSQRLGPEQPGTHRERPWTFLPTAPD